MGVANNTYINKSLYSVDKGEYIIEELPKHLLLPCLGLYPNRKFMKIRNYWKNGPVLIKVGNRQVAIGKSVAEKVQVRSV